MISNNKFYTDYSSKSSEELNIIANSEKYAGDSKLCAILILRERNELTDDLISVENQIKDRRTKRISNILIVDKYRTGFSRFLALIIDGIVISILSLFISYLVQPDSLLLIGLINFLVLCLPFIYNILFHGYNGQTIGKMIMGLRIYDKSEIKSITYKQAIIRDIIPFSLLVLTQLLSYITSPNTMDALSYIVLIVSFVSVIWSFIEIITMLFNSKRRALHDFIAGTIVLKIN